MQYIWRQTTPHIANSMEKSVTPHWNGDTFRKINALEAYICNSMTRHGMFWVCWIVSRRPFGPFSGMWWWCDHVRIFHHFQMYVWGNVLSWLYTGWWYTYPSEKYEFVSWDDYSQYMENINMFQTTIQWCMIWGISLTSLYVYLFGQQLFGRHDPCGFRSSFQDIVAQAWRTKSDNLV